MSVTATQPAVVIRNETARRQQSQPTALRPTAISLNAVFMEQQGTGRLEELAETLDFPLDFQI